MHCGTVEPSAFDRRSVKKNKLTRMAMFRAALRKYEVLNASHPVLVRGVAGVTLFAIGDYVAQRLQHGQPLSSGGRAAGSSTTSATKSATGLFAWDSERALRTSSWRAVVWAPM